MTASQHRFTRLMVACVYLAGYLLTFLHFVEERHAVCHEHGAQHHIAESTHDVLHGADDVPEFHAGAEIVDDHCSLFEFLRTSSFTIASAKTADVSSALQVEGEPSNLAATSQTRADNRRWRYAPKTSPPCLA